MNAVSFLSLNLATAQLQQTVQIALESESAPRTDRKYLETNFLKITSVAEDYFDGATSCTFAQAGRDRSAK